MGKVIIKKETRLVTIRSQFTRVIVNCGILILGISPTEGTMSLIFKSDKGLVHLLCDNFARLGNINRYARCYGIEFEKER